MNERQALDQLTASLNNLVANKETILKDLFQGITDCQKTADGMRYMKDQIEDASDATLRKYMGTMMNRAAMQNDLMLRLIPLAVVAISSDNFEVEVGQLIMRLDPDKASDVLQGMMKRKFKKS